MLFNSVHFLIFFPIVLLLYYAVKPEHRWILLLAASYYFYMCWKPAYILLILLATAINYLAALGIDRYRNQKPIKRLFLILGMAASLGMLFVFKYADFTGSILNSLFGLAGSDWKLAPLNLLLPVGISFYTFQAMSYTIDVYRGTTAPEKHFGYFALFVSFFPQLVAGPIEKSQNLLPQLHQEHPFTYENASYGLKLMAIGFFKKVVVADNLALFVNPVYNDVHAYTGGVLILATFFFAFQIYCDFSGYSDIARGCAGIMGINLMQNFHSPYLASCVKDFWRRWHISLSSWFRDYVYIPLGGNRRIFPIVCLNVLITFLLSGIWHGANYTFLIWGLLHGFYLVIGNIRDRYRLRIPESHNKISVGFQYLLKMGITLVLVCIAWIFFRANSMSDALYILHNMFYGISAPGGYLSTLRNYCLQAAGNLTTPLFCMVYIAILAVIDLWSDHRDPVKDVSALPLIPRWMIYLGFALLIILAMPKNAPAEFIYFQF